MDRSTQNLSATVLITTKDRQQDLVRAIESALGQSVPLEVLVVDDGSSDGTAEMVRQRFPQVSLLRNEHALGIIGARNLAAREARGEILFTLDDDALFSDSQVVANTLQDFENERVAVVAIPLVNHIEGRRLVIDAIVEDMQTRQAKDFPCQFVFRGGANALRRRLFLDLGSYGATGRQGEEHTYAVRLLMAGYVVRVASHGHVDHYPLPVHRDAGLITEYEMSNSMLFTWQFVPWPELIVHMTAVIVSRAYRALKRRELRHAVRGVFTGLTSIRNARGSRRPVSHSVYRLMRDLINNRWLPFSQVEPRLPKQNIDAI